MYAASDTKKLLRPPSPGIRIPGPWPVAALLALILPIGGCLVPGPRGNADSFGLDLSMPPGTLTRGAIVFVVGGVNAEVFDQMLQAGELPAIRKYFVDRGVYAPRTIGNIPSVSLAGLTSIATGQFPGHHGIIGNNWFDRRERIWRNYETVAQRNRLDGDYTARTIFEQFPHLFSCSVFFQAHRGAKKFFENWPSAGLPFFFRQYEYVDRLALYRLGDLAALARKERQWPAVTVCYLLAADFRAYQHGVGSAQYREALKHTDYQIGRVLGDLKRADLLDKLVIALVSDHGMTEVTRHFPIASFLSKEVGLDMTTRRLWEDTRNSWREDHYKRFQAVSCGTGHRYWALFLRKPIRKGGVTLTLAPWPVRPLPADLEAYPIGSGKTDLLSVLAGHEAVDAVAYAMGANCVRVRRKAGEVEFRQVAGRGREIIYRVISGTDPLGWKSKVQAEALNGKPMTQRWWAAATADTQFPHLPAQILAYFRAGRAPDIAVFAAPAWDFNSRDPSGPGGLRATDMHVPLMLAGPGVPHARLRLAGTVDLMPTLLKLLGRPLPPGLDGIDLLADLPAPPVPSKVEGSTRPAR